MANCSQADSIAVVLDAHPAAASKPDKDGMCPLHYGMKDGSSADAAIAVLKSHKEAAAKADNTGHYPIHLAMKNKAPAKSAKAVFSAYPSAICGIQSLMIMLHNCFGEQFNYSD